ncbi:TRAP transporter substrate-binding protein [Roseibium sp. HPY-6]|uniref:TRAP transporter substrate-binding protein n=1 Tax=Roseibium sp. HPY-6 TaxID=3229852 RepID=UPI00338E3308
MDRRSFLTTAGVAGAATLAAPAVARASSIEWKMTTAFPAGQPFYSTGPGSLSDFADRVRAMSGGRLDIQVYNGGELVPAFEGFDAVRQGIVQMNGWVSYFGAGKVPAAQFFGAVPFGMSTQGQNAWFYIGDGIKLWNEVYEPLGLVAMPIGATGVQMTGWFNKEINSIDDMKGLRLRIPGLAGKAYSRIGVDVKVLPGGEIFPALERGVIDAAEWVGPAQDKILGLNKAAKYYYTTGWHEPTTVTELTINKAAWDTLDAELQAIVTNAAAACNVISHSWGEANNAAALKEFAASGTELRTLPTEVVESLRVEMDAVYAEMGAADPLFKKVMDNYFAFKAEHDVWADGSEKVWHSELRTAS